MMKRNIAFCIVLFVYAPISGRGAITYDGQSGGRLGDQLTMFIKARWIAYHLDMPFFYQPFEHSDRLAMHDMETHYDDTVKQKYKKKKSVTGGPYQLTSYIDPSSDILYEIQYCFMLPMWGNAQYIYKTQEVMEWTGVWDDEGFIAYLKKTIAPRTPMQLVHPPADKKSVAVHVRMGCGTDQPLFSRQLYTFNDLNPAEIMPSEKYHSDVKFPTKCPPLQYYVDQIKRLSEMYQDQSLFVYIFTDDKDPVALTEIIQKAVDKQNITFGCERENADYRSRVLEDLFSMAQFDCFIRSASNYPQTSQLIGNHEIVIYPKSAKWVGRTLVIDDVGIFVRQKKE